MYEAVVALNTLPNNFFFPFDSEPHRFSMVFTLIGNYTRAFGDGPRNFEPWSTPELAPPLLTTTPLQREEVSALDRFNVHRWPTRRVFSRTGLELVTRQATIRYLYHSATAAEHLSERLGIRHVKTVVYRPQANRTERVNRDLVQMIANYANDQHDTWDQFLREFAYAIRTAMNETTGKTPAELFLGRKLITPFQKLVMVLDESRSFFRVLTGYFSNIPKCIKAEFIASWGCSQSSVVSSSQR
ncbi:uncharacterized protein TNCV_158501 [Trichonephila clavipes]|uniref:Uncharacterized protein n=1 Tax=Trichonephila clavipes TaxID=2585209 RepID=A0A8X6REE2_TRICX|nr:uncharacterized protein TNCV_158501 [Trichonephila clavipes]